MSARVQLIILLAGVAGLAGCERNTRRTPDDTVVYVLDAPEITDLDPRYLPTAPDLKVSRLVATGLVAMDQANLEPRLDLAASVELVSPTEWLVTLRPGVKFSDGSPLGADDVLYTFESILDPAAKTAPSCGVSKKTMSPRTAGFSEPPWWASGVVTSSTARR